MLCATLHRWLDAACAQVQLLDLGWVTQSWQLRISVGIYETNQQEIFRERRGIAKQYWKDKIVSCVFGSRCKTIISPLTDLSAQGKDPIFFPWVYFPDSVTHTLQLGVRLFSLEFGRHECSHVETLFLVGCGSAFGLLRSHVRWSGLESRLSTDFIPRSMATCSCRWDHPEWMDCEL